MLIKPSLDILAPLLPEVQIFEEIGSGGFKVVYKAVFNGREEALKLVQIPNDANDETVKEENLRRVHREIDILGKCESEYMVRLGSLPCKELSVNNCDYVVYSEELLRGVSVRNLIQNKIKPDISELKSLGMCLLQVIKCLAGKEIIHRDIKPDNIISTGDAGRPFVLLDFGIAFQIGGTNLTRNSDMIPGTLNYIAPEMLEPEFRQNIDYRADLYTVGLTLYEYASGVNPFARPDAPQFTTLYRIKTENPVPLLQLRPDLPDEFCSLADQLIKKLPALRPANITALLRKMEAIK